MQDQRFRPRTTLQPVLDRCVLRAARTLGLHLTSERRGEIVDVADDAAIAAIQGELAAESARRRLQTAGIEHDLERERIARQRHRYDLERKREAATYDRERGIA